MDLNQLDYELNNQKNNLNVLQECLKNIDSAIQNANHFENSNTTIELLSELRINLDNIRNNIINLENLKKQYSSLEDNSNGIKSQIYDELSKTQFKTINSTSNVFNKFILKYIKNTSFFIDKKNEIPNSSIIDNNVNETKQPKTNDSNLELPVYSNFRFTTDKNFIENLMNKSEEPKKFTIHTNYNEETNTKNSIEKDAKEDNPKDNNILLISEIKNKIFLPYKIEEIKNILEHSKRFDNIQQIIEKKYILPLDRCKNGTISRFKETYNFMRKKEKASITDSLDYALELAFNSKLNPAVILACKNLEELDTYLDCLELDETNKFDYFEVQYEFLPTKR